MDSFNQMVIVSGNGSTKTHSCWILKRLVEILLRIIKFVQMLLCSSVFSSFLIFLGSFRIWYHILRTRWTLTVSTLMHSSRHLEATDVNFNKRLTCVKSSSFLLLGANLHFLQNTSNWDMKSADQLQLVIKDLETLAENQMGNSDLLIQLIKAAKEEWSAYTFQSIWLLRMRRWSRYTRWVCCSCSWCDPVTANTLLLLLVSWEGCNL